MEKNWQEKFTRTDAPEKWLSCKVWHFPNIFPNRWHNWTGGYNPKQFNPFFSSLKFRRPFLWLLHSWWKISLFSLVDPLPHGLRNHSSFLTFFFGFLRTRLFETKRNLHDRWSIRETSDDEELLLVMELVTVNLERLLSDLSLISTKTSKV